MTLWGAGAYRVEVTAYKWYKLGWLRDELAKRRVNYRDADWHRVARTLLIRDPRDNKEYLVETGAVLPEGYASVSLYVLPEVEKVVRRDEGIRVILDSETVTAGSVISFQVLFSSKALLFSAEPKHAYALLVREDDGRPTGIVAEKRLKIYDRDEMSGFVRVFSSLVVPERPGIYRLYVGSEEGTVVMKRIIVVDNESLVKSP